MANTPKKACKGCVHCHPYYGNLNKAGKGVISKYLCSKKNNTCSDPKVCKFREETKK